MKVKHIPCGVFANESERLALEKISNGLLSNRNSYNYILLTNLLFSFDSKGLSDEIDLIVVAPFGVFVVEIKHWDIKYIDKNFDIAEHEAERLNLKVKKIAGLLKRHSIDAGFIKGYLLLTKANNAIPEKRSIIRGVQVYKLKGFIDFLKKSENSAIVINDINRICKLLEPKTKLALSGDIRTFASITNLELISPKEDRFHRIYRGVHISKRDKVILNIFDLSATDEENALEAARREFDIIQRLQKSPYLPRLMDSFQEARGYPGEIYFYTLVDPSAPTLEEIAGDKSISYDERIQVAINCLHALDELHNPPEQDYKPVVHRRLKPTNIKIKNLLMPIFTELTQAKLPDCTISPCLSEIGLDNDYTSPEVRASGIAIADARSDIYSLCSSLSLLFSMEKCSDALEVLHKGMAEAPEERMPIRSLIEELNKIKSPIKETYLEEKPLPVHLWDEDTVICFRGGYYKIVSKLGTGGIGMTFKVVQINRDDNTEYGCFVAKVINNEENAANSLKAYNKIRPHISHPNLAYIYEIATEWQRDNFAVLMKWIEGMPLSDLTGVIELYAEEMNEISVEAMLIRWLTNLCDALGRLHQAGFVHGDVTPKNIIVSGGDVVITDYDSVKNIGSQPEIFTSLYCSPSVQNRESIDPSDDIFSLAASFYHVLFDREPFLHGSERQKDNGFDYNGLDITAYTKIIVFLGKAVDPDKSQRFRNGLEARDFINSNNATTPPLPPKEFAYQEIQWLKNILRSYPGSLYGNDETRGLDSDFAIQTYVETNLDRAILEDIKDRRANLIILCGNAGDGKTAFLQNLAKNLGMPYQHSSMRLWDYTLPDGLRIRANLDGSASYQGRSASELLNEFFEPFYNQHPPLNLVHLVAINSGPLQAWLYEQGLDSPLIDHLQQALNGNINTLPEGYRFIDLNKRSLVGGIKETEGVIKTDFLDGLLERLLGKEGYWDACKNCTSREYCHIWEVVDILLNQQEKAKTLKTRLYEALQAVHQRGEIHITTRDLRASLIYILFGVYYCTDIHSTPDVCKERYYERAFAPLSFARQGEVLKELTSFDPALESHPKIDRYILGKGIRETGMPPQYHKMPLSSSRRRIYFEWTDLDFSIITNDNINGFGLARGKYLKRFRELPFKSDEELKVICYDLCRGISMLEDLPEIAFKNDGVPIRIVPRTVTESIFWVSKPFDRFSLKPLHQSNEKYLECLHASIELTYRYDNGSLESLIMGYELFYILMELKEGVQITDSASEDVFANLSIFTQRLAQENTRQLFAWNPAEEDKIFCIEAQNYNDKQCIVCKPHQAEGL